jgi:dTDP-4-dehydrorhamnose reductase
MKVVVLGAKGQLGTDLISQFADTNTECVGLSHEDLDVTEANRVNDVLASHKPDVVINTTAFHLVDLCEDEPEKTLLVNAGGARNVGIACRDLGAKCVYLSSDYVFGGEQNTPYTEADTPNPLSVYGVGKYSSELMTRATLERHFIVRSTGLYGMSPAQTGKGGNFVETVLRFVSNDKPMNVVSDQYMTPTATTDLAAKIIELIGTDHFGLYHMTNTDSCSWFEFAQAINELSGLGGNIGSTTSAEFAAKAPRPAYSVLDNEQMRNVGISEMRSWRDALADHMTKRMQL